MLHGDFTFADILAELAAREIQTVLVEGGGTLLSQAFAARAVDEVCWYVAPRICGDGVLAVNEGDATEFRASIGLADVWQQMIGDNFCVQGYPVWK